MTDVLIVESLDPDVREWLERRHPVRYSPGWADDRFALRRALFSARALIAPAAVVLDAETLLAAPLLRAVGRLSAGAENLDLEACARCGIEVVRPAQASATAEAEFAIAALLHLLRRVPVADAQGQLGGRELAGSAVGIVGLPPAARALAPLLAAFGARAVGYDPGVHAADPLWARWHLVPVGLRELFETCDAVCVLLDHHTRWRGLIGERFLAFSRPGQVMVCLAPSGVFDEAALVQALASGRMAAAWFDSLEPGSALARLPGVKVTPCVASTTLESRRRSAWAVARRIDELLGGRAAAEPPALFSPASRPGGRAGRADAPAPA